MNKIQNWLYSRLRNTVHAIPRLLGYVILRKDRVPESTLNLLDLLLKREALLSSNPIFFIQIGANDGIKNDPIQHAVRGLGLEGLLVEPLPGIFESLNRNYEGVKGLAFENCAIAGHDGTAELFIPRSDDPSSHQKASLRKSVLGKHAGLKNVESIKVPAMTFDSLTKKHKIKKVTLLLLDTEGFDFEILKQVFAGRFRPKLIQLEVNHLAATDRLGCRSMLSRHGYEYLETGNDLIAVHADKTTLS